MNWKFDPTARLWLDKPELKNTSLQFTSAKEEDVLYFRFFVRKYLSSIRDWFHQSDSYSYQMIEWWTDDMDKVNNHSQAIATKLGLKLETEGPSREYWTTTKFNNAMIDTDATFDFLDKYPSLFA